MSSSKERSAEDHAVLDSTRALIAQVQAQTGLCYAHEDWSPVSDITVGILAKEMGAAIIERPLGALVEEMALPPMFGPPLLAINTARLPGLRRLALRHGLAHLVAGELEPEQGGEIRMMSSAFDWMALEERRADLFALADLVPDRIVAQLRGARYSEGELARWVYCEIARYAPGWPPARLRDRAGLRLALSGECS